MTIGLDRVVIRKYHLVFPHDLTVRKVGVCGLAFHGALRSRIEDVKCVNILRSEPKLTELFYSVA